MEAVKYELNNYLPAPLYDEENKIKDREKDRKRRNLKRLQKQKVLFKFSCIACIVIFTITSLFILKGYSSISRMQMNITNLETRRGELKETKNSLVSELEESKGSIKISEEAMYKLSMDYPDENQIVYLSEDVFGDN